MRPSEAVIKTAYFDTNVFDHIHKEIGVTGAGLLALRSAVRAGRISILLSVLNLEEVLSALASSPAHAIAELRLILGLADWQRLVKPPNLLLSDDICCYARGDDLPEPFITDPVVESYLRALLNPSQQDIDELWPVVKETRQQKEDFVAGMREVNKKVLPRVKEFLKKSQGWRPSFEDYWEGLAGEYAQEFAERAGVLNECQKRGIEGLLEARSVRVAVGVSLSYDYSQTFEGRTPKLGDSRDMHHAVLATAGDMFVTQDRPFARLLSRISIEGFRVVDIRDLLEEVC